MCTVVFCMLTQRCEGCSCAGLLAAPDGVGMLSVRNIAMVMVPLMRVLTMVVQVSYRGLHAQPYQAQRVTGSGRFVRNKECLLGPPVVPCYSF